jgi:hypothetical protein
MSKYCQLYVPDDMVLAKPLSESTSQQLFLADAVSEYPSTDNQYPEVAAAAELVAGGWLWNAAENTWVPPAVAGWRWEQGAWVQEEEDVEEAKGIGGMWSPMLIVCLNTFHGPFSPQVSWLTTHQTRTMRKLRRRERRRPRDAFAVSYAFSCHQ